MSPYSYVIVFKYRASLILGYDAAFQCDLFLMFRGEVVVSNVGVRLSTDTASHPRLMKTPSYTTATTQKLENWSLICKQQQVAYTGWSKSLCALMIRMQKSGAQKLFVHPVGIWGFFVRPAWRLLCVFICKCMKFNSFYNSTFKIYKILLNVNEYKWSQQIKSTAHYKCHKFHNRRFRVHLEKCNWIW